MAMIKLTKHLSAVLTLVEGQSIIKLMEFGINSLSQLEFVHFRSCCGNHLLIYTM